VGEPVGRPGHRRQQQRRAHDREAGQVGQLLGHDDRRGRVADDRQPDLDQGQRGQAAEVKPDQHADADQAKQQPRPAAGADVITGAGEASGHDADQRHRGDQQPRQGARQVLLGVAEQQPRNRDLQDGERDQRLPASQDRAETARPEGQRQQHAAPDHRAQEHQRAR
jgi:hypothetical protein